MRFRHLAAGLALLTSGTVVGVTVQQFASADISSGDRPVLVPIESCRLVDTRPAFNIGPRSSPLTTADTDTIDTQQAGTECSGDIPVSATALAVNVTIPSASANGFVTLWAEGPRPNASTLNPQPGQLVFNATTVELAADDTFRVYNERGETDIIIDVIGYYENHDHDDRYYTKTQTDSAVAEAGPLVYGMINRNGSVGLNSGLIQSSVFDPADQLYQVTLSGIDFTTSGFISVATPHCASDIEPVVNVASLDGRLLVQILDDDPVADKDPVDCSFSFIIYGAP